MEINVAYIASSFTLLTAARNHFMFLTEMSDHENFQQFMINCLRSHIKETFTVSFNIFTFYVTNLQVSHRELYIKVPTKKKSVNRFFPLYYQTNR